MICFNEKDFMCEKMDDSAAILRVESQDVFLLNITSNYIMNSLLEQKSIEEIINEYSATHQNVGYDVICKDFIHIRNMLFEKGILYEY